MFRLEIFVDDRKLSYVLWALSGHCIEVKPPQPVANASIVNGKLRADATGDKGEMLVAHMRKHKIKTFLALDVQRWCESIGASRKNYSNVIYKALKAGLITRQKKGKKGPSQGFIYTVRGM